MGTLIQQELFSDEEQLSEWKKEGLVNDQLGLKKMPSVDFPEKRSGSSGLSYTQNKTREESCGAKRKSGLIISGWSLDKCGFLLGMWCSCVKFWLLRAGPETINPPPSGPMEDPMSHFSSIFSRERFVQRRITSDAGGEMK